MNWAYDGAQELSKVMRVGGSGFCNLGGNRSDEQASSGGEFSKEMEYLRRCIDTIRC